MKFARGEYLLFIDNDDLITKTALEELYPIAKKFDADVVHCDRYYTFNDDEKILKVNECVAGGYIKEPTLITENQIERMTELFNNKFIWALWQCLIRRDFFIGNNLQFIGVENYDVLLMWALVLSAKNLVRVPNIINLYRLRSDSLCHKPVDIVKRVKRSVLTLTEKIRWMSDFWRKQKFFESRPDLRNYALEGVTKQNFGHLIGLYSKIPLNQINQLNDLIRREINETEHKMDLMMFLIEKMYTLSLNLNHQGAIIQQQNQIIQQLKK